ncbi:protein kinase [Kribbella qitaiheensis]|uniref:Protein kinase n=1 Tax=Kribbella qitaiheensis TaxID=1544730 RepID=A0A7G6X6X6_9ACTN|nr:protein kinase [Kribbella qitaiheensis]QNE21991.1 protein kinase [Kribbella qitaiheensis]
MALEDIAGYSLRRDLGSGATGTVWLLRDLGSGRHAVLKRIPAAKVPAVEQFRQDLALTRSLDNPHIARLLDVRQTDRDWLLFSQYVPAGSLASLLERREPLSTGELVTLLSPLAQALAVIHHAGLTHGNLTPANVMLDAEGRPVLTDVGLRTLTHPSATPQSDLDSLAQIALTAGANPRIFTPTIFTAPAHQVATRILHLAQPTPITSLANPPDGPGAANGSPPAGSNSGSVSGGSDDPDGRTGTSATAGGADPGAGVLNGNGQGPRRKPPKDGSSQHAREPFSPTPTDAATDPATTTVTSGGADSSPKPPTEGSTRGTRRRQPTTVGRLPKARTGGRRGLANDELTGGDAGGRQRLKSLDGQRHSAEKVTTGVRSVGTGSDQPPGLAFGSADLGSEAGGGDQSPGVVYATGAVAGGPYPNSRRTPGGPRRRGGARGTRSRRTRRGLRLRLREAIGGRAPAYGVLAAAGAAALVVLLLGLITVGVLGGGASTAASTGSAEAPTTDASQSPPPSSAVTPTTSSAPALPSAAVSTAPGADWPTPWLDVLRALDRQRSSAFNSGSDTGLDSVYVRGSVPWKADKSLLATYRTQHLRIENLTIEIRSLLIESEETDRAVLQVVDRLTSGAAVDQAGRRTTFPPGKPTSRRITLQTTTPGTWRITQITTL